MLERRASLEGRVARLLTAQRRTLATVEAASMGMVAHRLTTIPGASAFFLGGIVAAPDTDWPLLAAPCGAPIVDVASRLRDLLGADLGVGVGPRDLQPGVVMVTIVGLDEPPQQVTLDVADRIEADVMSGRVLEALEEWLENHPML